jgi:hypothetical protein
MIAIQISGQGQKNDVVNTYLNLLNSERTY